MTYSANIPLSKEISEFKEVMFCVCRSDGATISMILPAPLVLASTNNGSMYVVGYGSSEGIFFKYVPAQNQIAITSRYNLMMRRVYVR